MGSSEDRDDWYVDEDADSTSDSDEDELDEQRQCLALECVKTARNGSKYCSHECCVQLATDRLKAILPGRMEDWHAHPSVAEQKNKEAKQAKLLKIEDLRDQLKNLSEYRNKISEYIDRVSLEVLGPGEVELECGDEDGKGNSYCVSCGQDWPIKSILKHMDKCFQKWENQRFVSTQFKLYVDGPPLFCGAYFASDKTYCCKLQVLCPKHTKPAKIIDGQICGYKLTEDITHQDEHFLDKNDNSVCRVLKAKCNIHYAWEKKLLADVDLQRVNLISKMDTLFNEIRHIEFAMQGRKSVMSLLLNHTTVHDSDLPHNALPFTPSFGFGGGYQAPIQESQPESPSSPTEETPSSPEPKKRVEEDSKVGNSKNAQSSNDDFVFKVPSGPVRRRKSFKKFYAY